jgi:hypothetical protein
LLRTINTNERQTAKQLRGIQGIEIIPASLLTAKQAASSSAEHTLMREVALGQEMVIIPEALCQGRMVIMVDHGDGEREFDIVSNKLIRMLDTDESELGRWVYTSVGAWSDTELDGIGNILRPLMTLCAELGKFHPIPKQAYEEACTNIPTLKKSRDLCAPIRTGHGLAGQGPRTPGQSGGRNGEHEAAA